MKSEIYKDGKAGVHWPSGLVVYYPDSGTWGYYTGGRDPGALMEDEEFHNTTGLPAPESKRHCELVAKAKASPDGRAVARR
jgi:hypothetical protein